MANTVFMIHGMTAGGWIWENYRKFFEQRGYACLSPTLRYHDRDPKAMPHPELGTTSLIEYVNDIETEIRMLPEKPIIMGHSMGGLITQILGSRGLGSALVLLCPAPPTGIPMLEWSAIKGSWRSMKFGFWKKPVKQLYEDVKYSVLNLTPEDEGKALYDKLGYESGRALWEIGFWFFDARKTTFVDESKIICPVLVIAGGQDRILPASVIRKIAKKYQAVAIYKEFPDHAHNILLEPGWEIVTNFIHEWFESISKGNKP